MKTIVYAGPHYGQAHNILSRVGNLLTVQHPTGQPFTINVCDAEIL